MMKMHKKVPTYLYASKMAKHKSSHVHSGWQIPLDYCSSRFYVDIVYVLSCYPDNKFKYSNKILHMTSYDHRVTKTYVFMHIFSCINDVISEGLDGGGGGLEFSNQ